MQIQQKNIEAANEVTFNESMKAAKELIAHKNYVAAITKLQVMLEIFLLLRYAGVRLWDSKMNSQSQI